MKLVRYLFKRFIPIFFGSIGFFSLVLMLVDLLMNLWKFIQNEAAAKEVAYLMLLYLPKTVWYSVPLGILFAVSYTLSDLYAGNELTAVFAGGVSLIRFTAPLLIFSFFMSFALFFFDDLLVVPTYAKKLALQDTLLGEEKTLDNESVVVLSDNSLIIYNAAEYSDEDKSLRNLRLVFRTEKHALDAIISSDFALWNKDENVWMLQNPVQYEYKDGTLIFGAASRERLARLTEPAETFRSSAVSVEQIATKDAKIYIEHLKRVGLPFNEELSIYYKKFSFPFIVFIVVFLSIGLSGKSRKNVLLISLSLSVGAAVLFYVMQMITMLLAKFGYISGFAGAWSPVIFFVLLSVVLLRYAKT